jgi:hypothetical protein
MEDLKEDRWLSGCASIVALTLFILMGAFTLVALTIGWK